MAGADLHRNGQLATEELYFDGRLHGVVRQWNEHGRLLGSFRMTQGTGTQKSWHDNGRLNLEFATVEGCFADAAGCGCGMEL